MELTWSNFYDPLVDPLVLAGSSLSLLATALVLLTFAVYHREQRTFRHALVLNLTIAEFINSLNATLSGSYFLITRELTPGMLCSMNGWVGQVSVQAADFSMFAIAVFTLLTIIERVYMPAISNVKKILVCISVWVIPFATGSIALGMGVMMPAGSNWCWISASRTDLRYALTQAWRFAIIFSIICIYGYVYFYTSRHFRSLDRMQSPTNHYAEITHARKGSVQKSPYEMAQDLPSSTPTISPPAEAHTAWHSRDASWLRLSVSSETDFPHSARTAVAKDTVSLLDRTITAPPPYSEGDYGRLETLARASLGATDRTVTVIETAKMPETKRIEREVKRMLLMNAYPIFYVLLSIPGMVNRLLQASGSPPPDRVLDALQAASAFIGFTNAVTYGFSRQLRQRIATDFRNWRTRNGTGVA